MLVASGQNSHEIIKVNSDSKNNHANVTLLNPNLLLPASNFFLHNVGLPNRMLKAALLRLLGTGQLVFHLAIRERNRVLFQLNHLAHRAVR